MVRTDLEGWRTRVVAVVVIHQSFFDLLRDRCKRLSDIDIALSTRFEKLDRILICQSLAPCRLDNLLADHIALISDQDFVDIVCCMLLDVPDPIADVLERVLVNDVIHQQNSHCPTVVCRGNCAESFLAGCVPNLQLHVGAPIYLYKSTAELYADGKVMSHFEFSVGEAQQKAGFADG